MRDERGGQRTGLAHERREVHAGEQISRYRPRLRLSNTLRRKVHSTCPAHATHTAPAASVITNTKNMSRAHTFDSCALAPTIIAPA